MKIYIGEHAGFGEDTLSRFSSGIEIYTVKELWQFLSEIKEPCWVVLVERNGEKTLEIQHPYDC